MSVNTDLSKRLEALHRSLTNHTPSPEMVEAIDAIRAHAKTLGAVILAETNASREQPLALTHLEETVMWAVKGAVLNGARIS